VKKLGINLKKAQTIKVMPPPIVSNIGSTSSGLTIAAKMIRADRTTTIIRLTFLNISPPKNQQLFQKTSLNIIYYYIMLCYYCQPKSKPCRQGFSLIWNISIQILIINPSSSRKSSSFKLTSQ